MKVPKVEILAGMTAICFLLLLVFAILDGVSNSEMIPIVIQIVGTLLAIATLMTERDIRIAEVKVKQGELGIKQAEADYAKDEWQRKQAVKYAKIRGRLLTWLASGPDAGKPLDASMIDDLRANIAGQTDLLEAYPPLAHLVADLEEAIQWDKTTGGVATHEHIEAKVRKIVKDLSPVE
jgi:multidrug efflux pump subunit AcrA (membrane-fusion protein)